MQQLEVTWGRVLRVWWLIFWRSTLGATVFGAIIGFVFGFVVAFTGLPRGLITTVSPILGAIIAIFWAMLVVRMALRKTYSDFQIMLVPRDSR